MNNQMKAYLVGVIALGHFPAFCIHIDTDGEQCFRAVYPEGGHVFASPEEHKSLTILFRVNCEGEDERIFSRPWRQMIFSRYTSVLW